MANVKSVMIRGDLPFNCAEHDEMCKFMGQLAAPALGLRLKFSESPVEFRPSQNGVGKTAYYHFTISGEEAVAPAWLQRVCAAIRACGGTVRVASYQDIEANEPTVNLD